MHRTNISAANAILLIAKLKPRGDVNLYDVNLSRLTDEQIKTIPEGLSVQSLSLTNTNISAANAMLLIAKLKPQGILNLGFLNLSVPTEEQIKALPEGLSVKSFNFANTNISAANAMLLIAKLKPRDNVSLLCVNLLELTEEQIKTIPEGLSVQSLSLANTNISAANAMLLIAKLKPQGILNLEFLNLLELTEEQIKTIPEGLSVQSLSLANTNISAANAMLLIAKLKPQGILNLEFLNLLELTEEQIKTIPEGLSVQSLSLANTNISAANAMLLIAKLKPQGILNLGFLNLLELTEEQIKTILEGLSVKSFSLANTNISAKNAMLLIAKLKPTGYVFLNEVDLCRLNEEQINILPEEFSVKGLRLNGTNISAANAKLLIAKLKPQGYPII